MLVTPGPVPALPHGALGAGGELKAPSFTLLPPSPSSVSPRCPPPTPTAASGAGTGSKELFSDPQ